MLNLALKLVGDRLVVDLCIALNAYLLVLKHLSQHMALRKPTLCFCTELDTNQLACAFAQTNQFKYGPWSDCTDAQAYQMSLMVTNQNVDFLVVIKRFMHLRLFCFLEVANWKHLWKCELLS